jgi:hypothetical protein
LALDVDRERLQLLGVPVSEHDSIRPCGQLTGVARMWSMTSSGST